MRLKGIPAQEFRFQTIVRLSEEGKTQAQIAQAVKCSQAWVSRILKRHRQSGSAGLKVKGTAPGASSRLSKQQLNQLKRLLKKGALKSGFSTDNWTRERIAQLIAKQFSVSYHPAHISRIMKRIGFSLQKPIVQSYRKDHKAEQAWIKDQLPALKKKQNKKTI